MSKNNDVALDDVFTATTGSVLVSGIQALVRLTLEQMWLDEARGLTTASFVSGYPGSPLGGVDMEFDRAKRFLDPAGVRFQHGLNEELAATAVVGTQFVDQLPGATYDGVVGYWFGKNPGLDRAARLTALLHDAPARELRRYDPARRGSGHDRRRSLVEVVDPAVVIG